MKIVEYIKDVKGEMSHVNWPKRSQATLFTILVIVVSIVVAIYLGALDALFKVAIEKLLAL